MNTPKTSLLAAALAIAATGCAPMIWSKPGATEADYNVDSYACERDVRQSGYFGGGIAGDLGKTDFFKRCMVSKGYTLQR